MGSRLELLRDSSRNGIGYNEEIDADEDLLDSRILDSFNIVQMAVLIQQHAPQKFIPAGVRGLCNARYRGATTELHYTVEIVRDDSPVKLEVGVPGKGTVPQARLLRGDLYL